MQQQGPSADLTQEAENNALDFENLFKPFPEKKFTHLQTQIILALLAHGNFFDFKEAKLLKEPFPEPAVNYFLHLFYDRLKFSSLRATIPTTHEFLALKQDIEKALNRMIETASYNLNYMWGQIYKLSFSEGEILSPFDTRVIVSLNILIQQLQEQAQNPDPKFKDIPYDGKKYDFHDLDEVKLRKYLQDFIGQLIKCGLTDAAQTIHDFFRIAKLISSSLEVVKLNSGMMSPRMVAMTITPCIQSALHLRGKLFDTDTVEATLYETGLIMRLIEAGLNTAFFEKEFNPSLYTLCKQVGFDTSLAKLSKKANRIKPISHLTLSRPEVGGKGPQFVEDVEEESVDVPRKRSATSTSGKNEQVDDVMSKFQQLMLTKTPHPKTDSLKLTREQLEKQQEQEEKKRGKEKKKYGNGEKPVVTKNPLCQYRLVTSASGTPTNNNGLPVLPLSPHNDSSTATKGPKSPRQKKNNQIH